MSKDLAIHIAFFYKKIQKRPLNSRNCKVFICVKIAVPVVLGIAQNWWNGSPHFCINIFYNQNRLSFKWKTPVYLCFKCIFLISLEKLLWLTKFSNTNSVSILWSLRSREAAWQNRDLSLRTIMYLRIFHRLRPFDWCINLWRVPFPLLATWTRSSWFHVHWRSHCLLSETH